MYDSASGVGIIVRDDDRSEVLLKPGSLDNSMFRFLRQGQRVRFDMSNDDPRCDEPPLRIRRLLSEADASMLSALSFSQQCSGHHPRFISRL